MNGEQERIEVIRKKRAEAGRIGGLKKVKKGFAVRPDIASSAGKVGGAKSRKNRGAN